MSEGQSQRSVASSARHRQEAEVATTEERELAVAETAATTARAAKLVMVGLTAARAELEATAAVDAARAATAELKAPTMSSSWRGRQRESRRRSGQPRTPRGTVAVAQTSANGDRGLYRRCGSPSPDRYHGHRGIQSVVRDVSPGVGWSTLTKINYVE
jgi:hypothetical protein